jgi:hypothetical protein
MRRNARWAAALTVTAFITGTTAPALAATAPKPKITFVLAKTATVGAPVKFSYTAKSIPKGDYVAIQRQIGTTGVWKTVRRLGNKGGKGTLPPLPMGKALVRVALFNKHNKGLTSVRRIVTVYGPVTLSRLCDQFSNVTANWTDSCAGGAVTIGPNTFSYVAELTAYVAPAVQLTAKGSTCRSIHIDFAFDSSHPAGESPANSSTLTLEQGSRDPVAASTVPNVVGHLDTPLDGGAWSLTTATAYNPPALNGWRIYVNGSMSCWTPSGA